MYVSPAEPGKQSAGWQMEILFVILCRERKRETNMERERERDGGNDSLAIRGEG
jgi:hypothetical protein